MATVIEDARVIAQNVNIRFYLVEGTGSLASRLRVSTSLHVDRADGRPGRQPQIDRAVDDAAITTFAAGDAAALRALLQKIFNDAKSAEGV